MSTKTNMTVEELSEIEELRKRLAELEKAIGKKEPEKTDEEEIKSDDYIQVMSLMPYTLNLSTKERGQGNIKKFENFGEVKRILFRELVDICEVHRSFLEAGFFYILDKKAIHTLGLADIYDKILDKEKIEKILNTRTDALKLYKSANLRQQQIIIEMLIKKLFENPDSVNLNVIDKISRESGIDIREKVENIRQYDEILEETNA